MSKNYPARPLAKEARFPTAVFYNRVGDVEQHDDGGSIRTIVKGDSLSILAPGWATKPTDFQDTPDGTVHLTWRDHHKLRTLPPGTFLKITVEVVEDVPPDAAT